MTNISVKLFKKIIYIKKYVYKERNKQQKCNGGELRVLFWEEYFGSSKFFRN